MIDKNQIKRQSKEAANFLCAIGLVLLSIGGNLFVLYKWPVISVFAKIGVFVSIIFIMYLGYNFTYIKQNYIKTGFILMYSGVFLVGIITTIEISEKALGPLWSHVGVMIRNWIIEFVNNLKEFLVY